ncbi:hypothetical protein JCM6882_003194 [Rhodosporidiobolus microsporus]
MSASTAPSSSRRLRILITNDDGTPSKASGHSPFVHPFALGLIQHLNASVRVVVPSSQKSWVGKAYLIGQEVAGTYYYPAGEDGTEGEERELPKKEEEKGEGEVEYVLLDGTPATCANIALHNLFPKDSFDVVISGPNFGRNTSTAFALSSGTLGAALAASLSGVPSIAVSFGLMEGYKPPPKEFVNAAVKETCKVVERLCQVGWGEGGERVGVYSVNVPLLPEIIYNPRVQWTTMAQTGYGALFRPTTDPTPFSTGDQSGPAAVPEPTGDDDDEARAAKKQKVESGDEALLVKEEHSSQPLRFKFAPDLSALVNPNPADLVDGTDKHALHHGVISITPVRAAFAEVAAPGGIEVDEKGVWKL